MTTLLMSLEKRYNKCRPFLCLLNFSEDEDALKKVMCEFKYFCIQFNIIVLYQLSVHNTS